MNNWALINLYAIFVVILIYGVSPQKFRQFDDFNRNITHGCMNTQNWCPCLHKSHDQHKCYDSKKTGT